MKKIGVRFSKETGGDQREVIESELERIGKDNQLSPAAQRPDYPYEGELNRILNALMLELPSEVSSAASIAIKGVFVKAIEAATDARTERLTTQLNGMMNCLAVSQQEVEGLRAAPAAEDEEIAHQIVESCFRENKVTGACGYSRSELITVVTASLSSARAAGATEKRLYAVKLFSLAADDRIKLCESCLKHAMEDDFVVSSWALPLICTDVTTKSPPPKRVKHL